MKHLFFTLVVPVYNVEQYLEYCIESVLKQTYSFFELIIVDDGSTDNSASICEKMARLSDKIVFLQQENSGVSSARNLALEKATGDYVLFLDSDDWLESNMLHELCIELNAHKYPDIAQFGYSRVFSNFHEDVIPTAHYYSSVNEYGEFGNYVNSVFSYAVKRDIICNGKWLFPTNVRYAEDIEFILKCFSSATSIVTISKVYYFYRYRPSSAMGILPTYSSALDNLKVAANLFDIIPYCKENNILFFKNKSLKVVNAFLMRVAMCRLEWKTIAESTRDYKQFYKKYYSLGMFKSLFYWLTSISTIFCVLYLKIVWRKHILRILNPIR